MGYDAPVMFKEKQHMAETLEDRIRQRAYHIWEANGRPSGRDEEFWYRAREMVATDHGLPSSSPERHQTKQTRPARPSRKRSRRASHPASSGASAPAT